MLSIALKNGEDNALLVRLKLFALASARGSNISSRNPAGYRANATLCSLLLDMLFIQKGLHAGNGVHELGREDDRAVLVRRNLSQHLQVP